MSSVNKVLSPLQSAFVQGDSTVNQLVDNVINSVKPLLKLRF